MTAWVASFGEIAKFSGKVLGQVYGLRVFEFFGEALRQSGILILSSTLVGMLGTQLFWGANPRAPIGG